MSCNYQSAGFISPQQCCTCQLIQKCEHFKRYYNKNANKYLNMVNSHVNKFPEKYQIRRIMVEKKVKKNDKDIKQVLILKGNEVVNRVSHSQLMAMKPQDLVGKTIFNINKQYQIVTTIKAKPISGSKK